MSRDVSPSRGFTLLEMLVVMTLLSLVMLAMGSSLRTIAQTEERIDERLSRADEMRLAVSFLRGTLGRISVRRVTPPPPAKTGVLFSASAQDVAWVGIMPARYGAGGRYFFRLSVEPDESGRVIAIRFLPWSDSAVFPDWAQAERRVLVRNVVALSLRYQDVRAKGPGWSTEWVRTDRAPDQIQLDIETGQGAWPSINLLMRPMPSGDAGSLGGAVFGGGS